jgi:hypothetical protein
MRRLSGWLSVVAFGAACNSNELPASPTAPSSSPSASSSAVSRSMPRSGSRLYSEGNWSPWFFPAWQPGIGEPLVANGTIVDAGVDVNDLCVPNLRRVWDARSSCRRFNVSVPSDGWLRAFLMWDASAPGFNESLAGEVVLVAPDGRMASSSWQHVEEQISAFVKTGNYGVLVFTYVPVSLPFQIKLELRLQ